MIFSTDSTQTSDGDMIIVEAAAYHDRCDTVDAIGPTESIDVPDSTDVIELTHRTDHADPVHPTDSTDPLSDPLSRSPVLDHVSLPPSSASTVLPPRFSPSEIDEMRLVLESFLVPHASSETRTKADQLLKSLDTL